MRACFLALALWLLAPALSAEPAPSVIAPDAFRDAALAGDRATVASALQAQHLADVAAHQSVSLQRLLFTSFGNLHPKVDKLTADWVADEPASPYALTARGWYLYAHGFAARGINMPDEVYPEAMAQFHKDHRDALAMFQKAVALQPDLIAASDGVLTTGRTTGGKAVVQAELARIMQIAPFPGSIRRAAQSLVPQWGGSIPEMLTACETYAPMVTDPVDFDFETCAIDVVLGSDLWDSDIKDAAAQALAQNTHPWLDIYRHAVMLNHGTPAEQVAALRKAETDPDWTLSPQEARVLDEAEFALSGATGGNTYPHLKTAEVAELAFLQKQADGSPFDGATLRSYINALESRAETPAQRAQIDRSDISARLKRQLEAMPYDAASWAFAAAQWSDNTLTGLEKAAPYQANALVYSNHGMQSLQGALYDQYRTMIFPEEAAAYGIPVESLTDDPARTDRVLYCPFIRNLRLMEALCTGKGMVWNDCIQEQFTPADIPKLMSKAANPAACEWERTAPVEALMYTPLTLDQAFAGG